MSSVGAGNYVLQLVQVDLELTTKLLLSWSTAMLLPLPPKCSAYRPEPPSLASASSFRESWKQGMRLELAALVVQLCVCVLSSCVVSVVQCGPNALLVPGC